MLHSVAVFRPGQHFGVARPEGAFDFYTVHHDGTIIPVSRTISGVDLNDLEPRLSNRLYNVLRREGHNTVADVLAVIEDPQRGWEEIFKYRQIGPYAFLELTQRYHQEWKNDERPV